MQTFIPNGDKSNHPFYLESSRARILTILIAYFKTEIYKKLWSYEVFRKDLKNVDIYLD